jgi:hypothetical protein
MRDSLRSNIVAASSKGSLVWPLATILAPTIDARYSALKKSFFADHGHLKVYLSRRGTIKQGMNDS